MPGPKKREEPELPDKTRPEDEENDVERQQPVWRPADDTDQEEVPARRGGGGDSGDIERGATPPAREGHQREMQERRPHRDEPV